MTTFVHCIDLQLQLDRALRLEEERRKVEQEAARLESERQAALLAKEELARQAEDQMKNQEQLVSTVNSLNKKHFFLYIYMCIFKTIFSWFYGTLLVVSLTAFNLM